jgi:hypothetical protein
MKANGQPRGNWGSTLRVLVFTLVAVSAYGQEGRKLIAQPVRHTRKSLDSLG